ncbi:MAG: iron ABC transporter permease [Jiangellales bacterium]
MVAALPAALVAALPLVYLLVRTAGAGWEQVVDIVWRDRTALLLARSLALAAVVTAASLVIGVGWAWVVTRTALPARRWWLVLGTLPLAVPSYLAAYAWISLVPGLSPFLGSALVLTLVCYPYVLLPVAAALSRVDPAAEDVARSLGKGPVTTLATVTLRQVRPAAVAGGLLVALYVLSDFGAVALLRLDTFTRVIYTSYRAGFDPVPAAVLSVVLVVVTGLIAAAEMRSRGRARQARLGSGVARRARLSQLSPGGGVGVVVAMVVVSALALAVPLGTVAWWISGSSRAFPVADVLSATAVTVGLALAAAAVTTVVAAPVGFLAARYPSRTSGWLERLSYVGFALPGIVVALSLVYLGVRVVYPLYQTTAMLLLAYLVLFLPMAVGSIRAAVSATPPVLEEMARSLGRTPLRAFASVTLPIVTPGVLAGAALVAVTVMKELPATLVLRPIGTETLATELWSATAAGAYAAAAPFAAALVLVAIIPAGLLAVRSGRS